MRTSAKVGLTALIAALLLSAAISTASARNLSVSNRNIRVTWSRLEFEGGGIAVRCRVTLEGSFHTATIAKVRGSLIGTITRADVDTNNCTNARVTMEALPWHITYEGFGGILPRIEEVSLLLRNMLFNIARLLGASTECRYGLSINNPTFWAVPNATGEVTNLIPFAAVFGLLQGRNETFLVRCPINIQLFGGPATDGDVMRLGTTTRIRLTLI